MSLITSLVIYIYLHSFNQHLHKQYDCNSPEKRIMLIAMENINNNKKVYQNNFFAGFSHGFINNTPFALLNF